MIRDKEKIKDLMDGWFEDTLNPSTQLKNVYNHDVNELEKYIEDERERAIRWTISQMDIFPADRKKKTQILLHKAKTELL